MESLNDNLNFDAVYRDFKNITNIIIDDKNNKDNDIYDINNNGYDSEDLYYRHRRK